MTAEKLYSTLILLLELDKNLGLQRSLDSIRDALNNLVGSPESTQLQSTLTASINEFAFSASKLREAITLSQREIITRTGITEFFDTSVADQMKDCIGKNTITPSLARDFVTDMVSRRERFMQVVCGTVEALHGLAEVMAATGPTDLVFQIPQDIFDNRSLSPAHARLLGQRILEWQSENGYSRQDLPFSRVLAWRIELQIVDSLPARVQLFYAQRMHSREQIRVEYRGGRFLDALDPRWQFIRVSGLEGKKDPEPSCSACIKASGDPWNPNIFPGVICENGWLCGCMIVSEKKEGGWNA